MLNNKYLCMSSLQAFSTLYNTPDSYSAPVLMLSSIESVEDQDVADVCADFAMDIINAIVYVLRNVRNEQVARTFEQEYQDNLEYNWPINTCNEQFTSIWYTVQHPWQL